MNTPPIQWYGAFGLDSHTKTPKYILQKESGYYPVMDNLKGRDNRISLYLMESTKSGSKESETTPPMRLQGKGSLNLTGLRYYFIGGKLSGFACGNPLSDKTYSKKNKSNPFYENRNDGFLFIFKTESDNPLPSSFEMIVLSNAKPVIASYLQMLRVGGFNDVLKSMREQATANTLFPI